MFTRRTATVTMSAPEAACACAMTACDGYLPVPTIRRDVKVRFAIVNGTSLMAMAATHKIYDLDTVAIADQRCDECMTLENHEIMLDRDASRVDLEPLEQLLHRQRLVELVWIPVERNAQGRGSDDCTLGFDGQRDRRAGRLRSRRRTRPLPPRAAPHAGDVRPPRFRRVLRQADRAAESRGVLRGTPARVRREHPHQEGARAPRHRRASRDHLRARDRSRR